MLVVAHPDERQWALTARWLGWVTRHVAAVATALLAGQVPLVTFNQNVLRWRQGDRVDFLRLLEEAARLQVLRQAGVVDQFRHATLQDRLVAPPTAAGQEAPGF